MDRLLIAGIDPGIVAAYALLDLNGNLISISSERHLTQSNLTKEIIKHGKIFIIGSDVYQCPNLTARIARSIGAKVTSPDHDLKYLEKIKIVNNFLKNNKQFIKLNNQHEKDALAAALYGLKRINNLIKKIKDHLEQNNKEYLLEEIKRKVLLENIPITTAVKMLS